VVGCSLYVIKVLCSPHRWSERFARLVAAENIFPSGIARDLTTVHDRTVATFSVSLTEWRATWPTRQFSISSKWSTSSWTSRRPPTNRSTRRSSRPLSWSSLRRCSNGRATVSLPNTNVRLLRVYCVTVFFFIVYGCDDPVVTQTPRWSVSYACVGEALWWTMLRVAWKWFRFSRLAFITQLALDKACFNVNVWRKISLGCHL